MSCTLIINPRSRGGKSAKYHEEIIDQCKKNFEKVKLSYASTFESIRDYSLRANLDNEELIVAVGGDGTINAVLNGFYNDEGNRISECRLGIIYTGTSPDFCKSYNIPINHHEAIKCLASKNFRSVMPGKISFRKDISSDIEDIRYFACCANIGIGAGIARDANRRRKYLGDLFGTLVSLLMNLATFRSKEVSLTVDGRQFPVEKMINISIGRTPNIASGIRIKDEGILDKDLFYCLIASGISLIHIPKLIKKIYTGNIGESKYLNLHYGRKFTAFPVSSSIEVEMDGDPAGYLPCNIELASEPVELIVDQVQTA